MTTGMTEVEDLSSRLTALETVVRQLLTHLAVRADDPPSWVATRRVLALHAVHEDPVLADDPHARVGTENAITGFFDQVEGIVEAYVATPEHVAR